MKNDVAELFERSQVSNLDYREITSEGRSDDALARWPVIAKTYELMCRGDGLPSARTAGAADFFAPESGR